MWLIHICIGFSLKLGLFPFIPFLCKIKYDNHLACFNEASGFFYFHVTCKEDDI